MCVVSMIGDHYHQKWDNLLPGVPGSLTYIPPQVTREEFEALKKEVLEMKELLKKAKEYDARTNQPNCEQEEKIALLKAVAKAVGVDLEDVLK